MRTRTASQYVHLGRKCIDMAAQAKHANNRVTLVRFAAIWLSLAADELTEGSDDQRARRVDARLARMTTFLASHRGDNEIGHD